MIINISLRKTINSDYPSWGFKHYDYSIIILTPIFGIVISQ